MKFLKITVLFLLCLTINAALAQKKPVVNQDPKTFKLFFEKVYLQLDRNYYNAGEDTWFAAYLVNGKSTSLTNTSNNLYVELINPKSQVVDQKLIRLDKGLGNGDFKLKDTLQTGWYNIRAYTNWMRNFGDDFVFQKRIYINNNTKAIVKKTDELTAKKAINFFPEGGSLIEGVNSLVAFKSADGNGDGLKTTASIISSKGDTVTTFQSTEAGIGSFTFTPNANEQYRVAGTFGVEKFSSNLPTALKKGLSLHVTSDSVNIKASITANDSAFDELKGKPLSVIIKHAGDNIYTGTVNLTKPTISLTIPTAGLVAGLAVFTVLDHLGRPNCERLIYIETDSKVNFTVSANKATYSPREQVTLNLKATNILGQPAKTSLSLAVVDGTIPANEDNIVSYLMLQSEVKGEIKNADQYFDTNNAGRFKQLDLLLLTQGWREYVWRKLRDSTLKVSYLPEPGLTIKGLIREKFKDKPLQNINITLFGTNFSGNKMFTTKTDASGRYFLDGLKWYGNQPIKISSHDDKGKKGGWLQIDTSFLALPINLRKGTPFTLPKSVAAEITTRMAYNRQYKLSDSILLNDVNISGDKTKNVQLFGRTLTTFGYPDQVFEITAADYDFKGLEHFLLTKALGAMPVEDLRSTDALDSNSVEGVLFVADGQGVRPTLIINNREDLQERLDFYSLTMDHINKVTISHLLGASGNGTGTEHVFLIKLDLKESAFQGPKLHLLNVNLNGYYAARNFYAPNYSIGRNVNKDLRTTIFWSPLIKTNEKGEASVSFYNGDNKGKVVVKAEGITDQGTAVTHQTAYKVQ